MRTAHAPTTAPHVLHNAGGWLARRWYYTPKTRRAYSVRQIAPGDRRLLAEFALTLGEGTADSELAVVRELSDMLFDRVLAGGSEMAVGFAALEATAAGDRIVGVAVYAPENPDDASFNIAVAQGFREEHVGRTLLATLTRHAKRVGLRRLCGEMFWANRAMQRLAQSTGFAVEAVPGDRLRRALVLTLK
jgi:RimJ/RimL family protein N-acetyltransferase